MEHAPRRLLGTRAVATLLVVAAVCDTLEQVLSPLTGGTTYDDLTAIAHHEGRFVLSVLVGMVGTLLFVPGLLGLTARTVHRAPVASRIAAALVCVGFPGFVGVRMGQAAELQAVRDGLPARSTADLVDHLSANPIGAVIVGCFLVGTVVGVVVLAVAVWRAGLPRVAVVLVGAFGIADMVTEGTVPGWISHLLLVAGLGWIAVALVRGERADTASERPAVAPDTLAA